jgi:hypothetical protein
LKTSEVVDERATAPIYSHSGICQACNRRETDELGVAERSIPEHHPPATLEAA